MDWKQFFAAIVGSLAWPTSIVVTVILLKAPIAKLLPKIRSFKYGDLHIDLEEQLAEVKAEVTASEPDAPLSKSSLIPPSAIELAVISPRSAVLMEWLKVERKIAELASQYDVKPSTINGRGRPLIASVVMRELLERGIINDLIYSTFKKLNRIRDEASHMTSREIEYDEAISMSEMCQWLLQSLDYSTDASV